MTEMRDVASEAVDPDLQGRRGLASPRTFPEQIADELGAAIVNGQYADGVRLIEQDLAKSFGVSRGPIRDALRLLERRGLVEVLPRRGAYVRGLSLNAVADLFNVRIALAGLAARTMATNGAASYLETLRRRVEELESAASDPQADPINFARIATRAVAAIVKGSGNLQLLNIMTNLGDQTFWVSMWRNSLDFTTEERRSHMANWMREALNAIEAGRPQAAADAVHEATIGGRNAAMRWLAAMRDASFDPAKLVSFGRDE